MDSELDDEQQDDVQSLNVIEVHLEEPYEVSTPAPEPSNTVVIKGKYYKQTYRPAWESMPDFKGNPPNSTFFFEGLITFFNCKRLAAWRPRRTDPSLLFILPEVFTCPSAEPAQTYLHRQTSESSSDTYKSNGLF